MNCEKCGELLIDYMNGELSSEVSTTVKEHLKSCSQCRKEFEEYSEIRMAAQEEELPEASVDVLQRLSKAASDDLQKDKAPFWKKWSYSPILVPAVSAAIALSVWFYFGYDAVNVGPEVAVKSEDMAVETKMKSAMRDSEDAASITADNLETEQALVIKNRGDTDKQAQVNNSSESPQTFAYKELPASPSEPKIPSSSEFVDQDEVRSEAHIDGSPDAELLAKGHPEALSQKPMSLGVSEQKGPSSAKSYISREQSGMSFKKETQDYCDVSIRTNEAIINSSVPPSKSVQKESYKSLAECYEQKGELDKAVSNYINLRQVAPEEASFANGRIKEIRNRIKLELKQEELSSDPIPAN